MRNTISSQSYLLPDEVLAEIFKHVVYTPGPDDKRYLSMVDGLKRVFGRLHSLLGVCSTWRNVGIARSELWLVIPAADSKSRCPTPAATFLAIERSRALASDKHYHRLAVALSSSHRLLPPLIKSKLLQYHSISIEARFKLPNYEVSHLLEELLESQTPSVMSELSVHRYQDPWEDSQLHRLKEADYLCNYMSAEGRNQFTHLIASLSVLQLRDAYIHWNTITFSDKFVALHLQSVALGDHSKLNELLSALQSTPELREVTLVSVVAFTGDPPSAIVPVKISLPKLQSLLLDDLPLNVLKHVLDSMSPGSHRLKVGLTPNSYSNYYSEDEIESWGDSPMDLLACSNIDTLFLDLRERESPWVDSEELQDDLQALPCLKNLIMSGWKWDLGAILALERPRSDLTGLYILDGYITDAQLLPQVVSSYSLQTLVLDSHSSFLVGGDRNQIISSLRAMVPDFRLVRGMEQMDEFNYYTWRFW